VNIFLICLGGSLGAICRFYLSSIFQTNTDSEIPIGIFIVNVTGCFLLGLFYNLMDSDIEKYLTPFLFVGFLGSFTTFSAFSKESIELFTSGNIFEASLYILLSVLSCLIATYFGMTLTKIN
tara:strand:+ start:50 stop:415 length:366 start_codon:yes stop_codon:yes gene_type:complete